MSKYSINDIAWNELRSAHGTCEHYPNVFKDLISKNPKKRDDAYWQLDNFAVLQGDIYEVAPYAADILVGILRSCHAFPGRSRIYDFLTELAYGDAEVSVFSNYAGKATSLKEACDIAIRQGIEIYLADLAHDQQEVRLGAARLLQVYPESLVDKFTILESRITVESDQRIKTVLREVLKSIS